MSWLGEKKNVNKYISHLSLALKVHLKLILKNSFREKIKDQLKRFYRGWGTSLWNNITSYRQGNEIYCDQQSSNRLTEPQNCVVKMTAKMGTGTLPVMIVLIFCSY